MDSYDSGTPSPAETPLSRRKKLILAISMAEIEQRVDQWLYPEKSRKRARDSDQDSCGVAGADGSHHAGAGCDGARNKQKRARREPIEAKAASGHKFACPFSKHDPARYKNVKTCCGPGWSDVHRVKEHIYRRHSLKNACPRCFEVFNEPKDLMEHQRAEKSCRLKTTAPTDVITDAQEKQLHARAKANCPQAEKWQEMYRIIFPDEKVPSSPYYDSAEQAVVAKVEEPSGLNFKDADECKEFLKRELLRAVKPILEAELDKYLQVAQINLTKKAHDLVKDVQSKVFQTWQYQSAQAREPTPEPEEATPPPAKVPGMEEFDSLLDGLQENPMYAAFLPQQGQFDMNFFMAAPTPDADPACGGSVVADSGVFSISELGSGSWEHSPYLP
ncbi:hypothetical protein B0H67DRAFT_498224 [Lasiosphaeris hirsuta]|uniref:C2H2-type domain-containing protein n=1 Tax=Lasiosphaeris hirsuta TaxID=260670 RepID=A0AA39ZXU4_9PEZI|nr:hypothetical protein B0H67DRAFT_498224 [Lasiosphaeris hirsuta]